jgi:hypothetical protein
MDTRGVAYSRRAPSYIEMDSLVVVVVVVVVVIVVVVVVVAGGRGLKATDIHITGCTVY